MRLVKPAPEVAQPDPTAAVDRSEPWSPRTIEAIVEALDDSGEFRILRRPARLPVFVGPVPADAMIGCVIDFEATSRFADEASPIEIAMLKFVYRPDSGEILGTFEPFQRLIDPGIPIPPEVVALTGIDDHMVAGKSVDAREIGAFISDVSVMFAHNARYDRVIAEKRWPIFADLPWLCTMAQIAWPAGSTRLEHLATCAGVFYDGHRALDDCVALLDLLARPLADGRSALVTGLENARKPTWLVFADRTSFDKKELLKRRGYRWRDGGGVPPRSWWVEVADDRLEVELDWLRDTVYLYHADVIYRKVTAYERYSRRAS